MYEQKQGNHLPSHCGFPGGNGGLEWERGAEKQNSVWKYHQQDVLMKKKEEEGSRQLSARPQDTLSLQCRATWAMISGPDLRCSRGLRGRDRRGLVKGKVASWKNVLTTQLSQFLPLFQAPGVWGQHRKQLKILINFNWCFLPISLLLNRSIWQPSWCSLRLFSFANTDSFYVFLCLFYCFWLSSFLCLQLI